MATGHSARPAGFLPRSPGWEGTERTSQPQEATATCPGEGSAHGTLARGLVTAGGSPRPHDPHVADSAPATRGAAPGVSSGGESEPAAAGAAEGGRLYPRGRELESALRAGGRLASRLGLCSATAAPPPLRLPEHSAPGRPAPGFKRSGGEGRGGERARRQKVTPGEGGRKRVNAASGEGGGGRQGGQESEESVSGELVVRGSGGGGYGEWRETKRTRNLSQEQLQPSGIANKTSFPALECLRL